MKNITRAAKIKELTAQGFKIGTSEDFSGSEGGIWIKNWLDYMPSVIGDFPAIETGGWFAEPYDEETMMMWED